DRATARAIETLNPKGIGDDRACGRIPIRGLLQIARQRHLRARTLDLRTSGDTAGPRDHVVGYGAFAFLE
ncbi:MAG: AmmeMemoRadiSam system protein B, partial [Verrucomicrobia bacterium]|nr:AmmeMemoRadiSam system protein B [Verrucomicrobiota bacterium]